MSKNDEESLMKSGVQFVDGVLRVFEGFAKARVSFLFVEGVENHVCTFCRVPTAHFIQCKTGQTALTSLALCQDCFFGIKEAHSA